MLGIKLANNIINYSIHIGSPITNLKLQGIMYLINLEYIKTYEKKLLDEDFEAWQYSPVLRTVYQEFAIYGNNPISKIQLNYDIETEVETLMKNIVDKYSKINSWEITENLNSDKIYQDTIKEKGIKSIIDYYTIIKHYQNLKDKNENNK